MDINLLLIINETLNIAKKDSYNLKYIIIN